MIYLQSGSFAFIVLFSVIFALFKTLETSGESKIRLFFSKFKIFCAVTQKIGGTAQKNIFNHFAISLKFL